MSKFSVLVCGGRDYHNRVKVYSVLDKLDSDPHSCIGTIIEGGAKGADRLGRDWAEQWAKERNILVKTFVADWDTHGKAAGYIRNQQMLVEGKPDLVVAFPGGKGTANMVKLAKDAGVEVIEIE